MDNHDDNQYKLLIDTVNNNRSDKTYSTSNLNAISQCSLYPLTLLPVNNSRLENHGSSRRKCAALFKGITIEEFLEADDDPYSLTAIDKLILKNKAALAEDQMKKARSGGTSRSTKETAPGSQSVSAGGKKPAAANGAKKAVKRILGSKLANKRKTNNDAKKPVASDKCNGVSKANGNAGGGKVRATTAATTNKEPKKQRTVTVLAVAQKKENSKSRNGIEDVNGKEPGQLRTPQPAQPKPPVQQRPQQRPQQQAQQRSQQLAQQRPQQQAQQRTQQTQPKLQKPEAQQKPQQVEAQPKARQQLSHSPKKQQRAPQPGKKRIADGARPAGRRDMRAKLKQNAKQSSTTSKKSREVGLLKSNLIYQTRSGNKEKLRNGKSRIFREEESPATPSKPIKRQRRCDEGAPTPPPLPVTPTAMPASTSNPLKRIKQEPRDLVEPEVVCEKRRRLSEIKVEVNKGVEVKPVESACAKASIATSEQTKQLPIECVPAPTAAPPKPVTPEVLVTIKEEDDDSMKEEFTDDFIQEDGADLIDINFITSLLASSDKVLSSLKTKTSTDDESKLEAVPSQTDLLTGVNTLQNGDISRNMVHSTTETVRTPLTVPSNGQSERGCKADVPTNLFLSEVNNRLNQDNSVAKESMFNALGLQSTIAKESMFNALGLQSISKPYPLPKECEVKDKENYTGTLKAIIKVDKGCRRMEMKQKDAKAASVENSVKESPVALNDSTDACDKSTLNCDSTDNSIDDMEPLCIEDPACKNAKSKVPQLVSVKDGETVDKVAENNALVESLKDKNKIVESLVVPEKSSSFSIHPDRLCSDVCKYCFGKFGSLDTPCHVAQLKNEERQRKILLSEPNLKLDTCLCDACFRYVDRKANRPPKRKGRCNAINQMNQRTMCAVQNCNQFARHYGKRKWRLRVGKKIPNLCVDVTKSGSRVSFGLCSQHFCLVESFPSCGICKKRSKRKELTSIRAEVDELNEILSSDGIPVKLADNAVLCKYCHNCVTLRKKYGDSSNMSPNNRQYYQNFLNEILRLNNVSNVAGDGDDSTSYEKKKPETGTNSSPDSTCSSSFTSDTSRLKGTHNVDIQEIASLLKPLDVDLSNDKNSTHIQLKFGNLNIGKLSNLNIGQNTPVPKPSEPKASTEKSPILSEKEVPLFADFKFESAESSSHTWEKCVSTILIDKSTKKLWQELQQPYGNQSSFVRHLIMLEKHWRSGALVLADSAEPSAVKYINSVKNRVASLGSSTPPKLTPAVTTPSLIPPSTTSLRTTTAPSPMKVAPSVAVSGAPSKQEANVRHASTPPPLLKLGSYPMPMARSSNKPSYPVAASAVHTLPGNISLVAVKSVATTAPSTPSPSPPLLTSMPPPLTSMPPQLTSMPPPPPPPPRQLQMQKLPPPPQLEKIVNRYPVNKSDVTYNQLKESMDSRLRVASPFTQDVYTYYPPGPRQRISVRKGAGPAAVTYHPRSTDNGNPAMRSSTVTVNFPSKQFASPLMRRPGEPVHISTAVSSAPPASLIAKLPKALTVTQISETVGSHRRSETQPSPMAAPFLVGEKPSVSVFREITKN